MLHFLKAVGKYLPEESSESGGGAFLLPYSLDFSSAHLYKCDAGNPQPRPGGHHQPREGIPGSTLRIIADYVEYVGLHYSPAMLAGALALMATTSSAAFRSIMGIMAEIQGEHRYRGFWPTVFSFVYSVVFLAAIYLSCIVIVTGNWFLDFAAKHLGVSAFEAGIWRRIRFALLFFILLFIIYGVYRLSAPLEKPRSPRMPGALIATVAMVFASMFFSWTMELSTSIP